MSTLPKKLCFLFEDLNDPDAINFLRELLWIGSRFLEEEMVNLNWIIFLIDVSGTMEKNEDFNFHGEMVSRSVGVTEIFYELVGRLMTSSSRDKFIITPIIFAGFSDYPRRPGTFKEGSLGELLFCLESDKENKFVKASDLHKNYTNFLNNIKKIEISGIEDRTKYYQNYNIIKEFFQDIKIYCDDLVKLRNPMGIPETTNIANAFEGALETIKEFFNLHLNEENKNLSLGITLFLMSDGIHNQNKNDTVPSAYRTKKYADKRSISSFVSIGIGQLASDPIKKEKYIKDVLYEISSSQLPLLKKSIKGTPIKDSKYCFDPN